MRVLLYVGVLPLLLALAACGGSTSTGTSTPAPVKLTVFAAASLQGAFTDIGKAYSAAHPNVTVTFNFAGSDALATQINSGRARRCLRVGERHTDERRRDPGRYRWQRV